VRTRLQMFIPAVVLALLAGLPTWSLAQQEQPPTKPANPFGESPGPLTAVKVQIVFSRFVDGKKVSNLPYTLTVNANDGVLQRDGRYAPFSIARLRTGAEVPLVSTSAPSTTPAKPGASTEPTHYKNIGTNIDANAHSTKDGRYSVNISIEDTSVYAPDQRGQNSPLAKDAPIFRTFSSRNTLLLRDGQTAEFSASADRIAGDETRVSVTLNVVK
jgi:hypothetical protein